MIVGGYLGNRAFRNLEDPADVWRMYLLASSRRVVRSLRPAGASESTRASPCSRAGSRPASCWPSFASSGIIPNHHENLLLPPHPVSIPAGGFRADVPVGLGGRAAPLARLREDARALPGVPR